MKVFSHVPRGGVVSRINEEMFCPRAGAFCFARPRFFRARARTPRLRSCAPAGRTRGLAARTWSRARVLSITSRRHSAALTLPLIRGLVFECVAGRHPDVVGSAQSGWPSVTRRVRSSQRLSLSLRSRVGFVGLARRSGVVAKERPSIKGSVPSAGHAVRSALDPRASDGRRLARSCSAGS